MGGSHLGDRAAALVDDELTHGARERVLAHLAGCLDCRAEVEAARALKRRLAGLGAPRPSVEPSADLMLALLKLGESGPPAPPIDSTPLPGGSRQPSWFGVAAPRIDPHGTLEHHAVERAGLERSRPGRPLTHARPLARRPLRVRAATVGAFSMAAATLGSAVMLGVGGGTAAIGGTESGASQHASHGRVERRQAPDAVPLTETVGVPDQLTGDGTTSTLAGIPLALPSTAAGVRAAGASTTAVTSRRFGTGGLAPSSFGTARPFGVSSGGLRAGSPTIP